MPIHKKILGGIGDVAKFAAPAATLIPGVGPLAAGLIGAGGGLLGRLNDDDNRGAGGTVGDALKFGALGGVGGAGLGRLSGGGGEGGPGFLARIGAMIEKDPAGAAQLLTGGLGIIQGARSQGEAQQILRDLVAQQQAKESMLDPVRDKAVEGLVGGVKAVRPNLDYLFQSQNAFGRVG